MHPLEQQLAAAANDPSRYGPTATTPLDTARLDENLAVVQAVVASPAEPRLARVLRRMRVPDRAIPLITATPALRRSWIFSVLAAVLFALSVAGDNNGLDGVERIRVFLTLAPLVPLAGVALAFGPSVDPTHELVVAAPVDTFRVFMIRAATVLAASVALLSVAALLLPTGGAARIAWLLPSVALLATTMVGSIGRDPRRVAGIVSVVWVIAVIVIIRSTSAATMFGPITQLVAVVISGAAASLLWSRRDGVERSVAL